MRRLGVAALLMLAFPAGASADGNGVPAVVTPIPYDGVSVPSGASVAGGGTVTACPGATRTFRPTATDPDGGTPTFEWTTPGGAMRGSPLTLTAGRTAAVSVLARSSVDTDVSPAVAFRFGADTPTLTSLTGSTTTPLRRQPVTLKVAGASACALTYEWDFDGDGSFNDASGESVTYTPQTAGATVQVRVRAQDGAGPSATRTITLRVQANKPPTATVAAGRPDLLLGEATTLSAVGADVDGDVAALQWDFDGDGTTDATGASVRMRATAANEAPTVKVVDDLGAITSYRVPVTTFGAAAVSVAPASGVFNNAPIPAGTVVATYAGTDGRRLTNGQRDALRQTGVFAGVTLAIPVLAANVRQEQVDVFVPGPLAKRLGLGGNGTDPVMIATGNAAQSAALGPGTALAVAVAPTPQGRRVFARVRRLGVAVRVSSVDGAGAPVSTTTAAVLQEEKRSVRVRSVAILAGRAVSRVRRDTRPRFSLRFARR